MSIRKLFLFAATALSTCVIAAKAQNADEIIGKHIEAMGGTDNWNKINSMKLIGSVSANGMEIKMTQTVVNNKGLRKEMNMMGMNGFEIVTTNEGWAYMPFQPGAKVTPLPPEMLKGEQRQLQIKNGMFVDKSDISKSEYISMDTINSVACYKLKLTDKDGDEETAYFDASTYYIVRIEAKAKVEGEEQEMAMNFSNFQKQPEGIVYPMTLGSPQGDLNIKSIELNKPVDDNIFKPSVPDAAPAETAPPAGGNK